MESITENKYHDKHYAKMSKQPIEIMQDVMTHEMFLGLLLGQCIKYHKRAGNKEGESFAKDLVKRDRYIVWYYHSFALDERIDPRLDYDMPKDKFDAMVKHLDTVCKE